MDAAPLATYEWGGLGWDWQHSRASMLRVPDCPIKGINEKWSLKSSHLAFKQATPGGLAHTYMFKV